MSGTIESKVISPSGGAVQGTAILSAGPISSGYLLAADGAGGANWILASGTGTVTSVGVVTDSTTSAIFANTTNNLTNSPVTSSGNISLTLSSQTAKTFLSAPNGGNGVPTFRAIVASDVPTLNQNTSGTALNITATSNSTLTTLSALSLPTSQLSGTITGAQLPTFTGDVTNSSAAMTVAKIAGVAVGTPTGTGNVVFSAGPTFTSSVKFGNYHMEPSEASNVNSGSSVTLDFSTGAVVQVTLNAATPALTFSNPQAGAPYLLKIVQDGSGSRVPTFSTTIDWGTLGAPTLSTTAGKVDYLQLVYSASGWRGLSYALGYSA